MVEGSRTCEMYDVIANITYAKANDANPAISTLLAAAVAAAPPSPCAAASGPASIIHSYTLYWHTNTQFLPPSGRRNSECAAAIIWIDRPPT